VTQSTESGLKIPNVLKLQIGATVILKAVLYSTIRGRSGCFGNNGFLQHAYRKNPLRGSA
jgi:hypothetical protein